MKKPREMLGLVLLMILGVGARLVVVSRFPALPIFDFKVLVEFGLHLRDGGLISKGSPWFWDNFNPGLPAILAILFDIFPTVDPGAVGRVATAFACGLTPILPFLIWRGILPFWVRFLAGLALAAWPGQILFSGTVAQDNWVLLPVVALGSFAVRSLYSGEPTRLITAGLLYMTGVAMRQEMLLVMLPLYLAATRVDVLITPRRLAAIGLAVALPLALIAAYQYACIGRFALGTRHRGLTILGSYIPGVATNGWTQPFPFMASVRPDALRDPETRLAEALPIAIQEALRRPVFHAGRVLSSLLTVAATAEAESLYVGSLGSPDAMPAEVRERAAAVAAFAARPLRLELAAIQGMFLAAVLVGIRLRNAAIAVLASAVLLKVTLHALISSSGRFHFAATALEFLIILIAVYELRKVPSPERRLLVKRSLAVGALFSLALLVLAPRLAAYVRSRDLDGQRTYRFVLEPRNDADARLACVVGRGLLSSLGVGVESATIRTFQPDPPAGDFARAECDLSGSAEPRPLFLDVLDPYIPGGFPDKLVQRVEIDGAEVYSHDIARETGSGWSRIPLGAIGAGTSKKIVVEVKAINPDPGPAWGSAAATTFRLSRP